MSVKIYLNSDNGLVIEEANGVIYNRTQGDLSAKSENGRIEFSYSASGASFKDYAILDVSNALGVAYGTYAAIISAISDFFVDAALAAAEQLAVDLGVEVQNRTSEDINLQNQINTVVSGYLGAIAYNAAAPTPAKNGWYDFSTGGVVSWIAGTPTVKVGDRVSVLYTAPSTYVYTYLNINLSGAIQTQIDGSVSRAKIATSYNIFSANASSPKIPQLEEFILDMRITQGGNHSTRYYLDEFRVNDNSTGYKIRIKDSNDTQVMFSNLIYVAPTIYPLRNNDSFTVEGSGMRISFTVNWDKFISLIYNETTISTTELNNNVIFGYRVSDAMTSIALNSTAIYELNSKTALLNPYPSIFKINIIGDSYIGLGYDDNRGFLFYAAKMLGINKNQIGNYGIGGTKLARTFTGDVDSTIMVNRYQLMTDCDLLCIMGGYNDAIYPFADWTSKLGSSATKSDKTTIWGAFSCIIEGFMAQYPYSNTKMAVMTYPYAPDAGKIALNNTIRNIADYYNITLIDFEKKCGFIKGFNCQLTRDNLIAPYVSNWIDGFRPNYKDGVTILAESGWSFIPDYIQRPANSKTIAIPINCNLHQYRYDATNHVYIWIKQSGAREAEFTDDCTHIRIAYYTANKNTAKIIVSDGTVVDYGDIHPNIFGFRRMASLFSEEVKSIALPL